MASCTSAPKTHFFDAVTVMQWHKGRWRRLVLMRPAVTPSLFAPISSARNSMRFSIITLTTSPRATPLLLSMCA